MNSQPVPITAPPPSPPPPTHPLSLPHPTPLSAPKYNLIARFDSHSEILPLDSPKFCLKLAKVIFKNFMSFLV